MISVPPETGVRAAFFKMKEHHIRHLPVVNEKNELVGIVSDRESRRPKWVDESMDISHVYYLDDEMTAGDAMITRVHVVHLLCLFVYDFGGYGIRDKTINRFFVSSGFLRRPL